MYSLRGVLRESCAHLCEKSIPTEKWSSMGKRYRINWPYDVGLKLKPITQTAQDNACWSFFSDHFHEAVLSWGSITFLGRFLVQRHMMKALEFLFRQIGRSQGHRKLTSTMSWKMSEAGYFIMGMEHTFQSVLLYLWFTLALVTREDKLLQNLGCQGGIGATFWIVMMIWIKFSYFISLKLLELLRY